MKIGDKVWIKFGFDIQEAEILDLPDNGALVEYRIPFSGVRIGWLNRLTGWYYTGIDRKETFKNRIIN